MTAYDARATTVLSRGNLLLFILIALLASMLCLDGCRRGDERHTPTTEPKSGNAGNAPDFAEESRIEAEFKGASMTWRDAAGAPVWEAKFKEAVASQEGSEAVVELHGVEAGLYKDGVLMSRLTAPRVKADSRTGEVNASGGVKLISALHGASARADRLIWKSRENRLVGTGGVRMTRQNMSVAARSFEADTALQKVRFTEAGLSLQ